MNWGVVSILTAIIVGFVGFCLMVAAFVLVARQGWRQAMRSGPNGRWSLPRRLMWAGAIFGPFIGVAVGFLFLIPDGIAWPDSAGWSFVGAVLPPIAAVWYFIIWPAFASRRNGTVGHHSEQSNARSNG